MTNQDHIFDDSTEGDTAHCDNCGRDVIIVDGVTAIRGRGNWWCVHCVKVYYANGVPYMSSESSGKLVQKAIPEVDAL